MLLKLCFEKEIRINLNVVIEYHHVQTDNMIFLFDDNFLPAHIVAIHLHVSMNRLVLNLVEGALENEVYDM